MSRIRQEWGLYPRNYSVKGRKKTVWWAYVWENGKRKCFSTGLTSKAEAHNEVMRLVSSGNLETVLVQKGETVASMGKKIWDWDGEYITGKKMRGRMSRAYVVEMGNRFEMHVVPTLGQKTLASVSVADLESLFLNLSKILASKSVNNIYAAAKAVFDEAERLDVIVKNPFRKMRPFDSRSAERDVLGLQDAGEILHQIWWRDPVVWAINLTAAATGARVAELCALRVKDVSKDRVWIGATVRALEGVVDDTKTGDVGKRFSAIPPVVFEALRELTEGQPPIAFVFRDRKDEHLGLEVPLKQLRAAIGRMNERRLEANAPTCPVVTFHAWRHFVVSQLSAKCSSDAVSLHVGHAVGGIKGRYLHQTEAHIQDCLKGVSDIFNELGRFGR